MSPSAVTTAGVKLPMTIAPGTPPARASAAPSARRRECDLSCGGLVVFGRQRHKATSAARSNRRVYHGLIASLPKHPQDDSPVQPLNSVIAVMRVNVAKATARARAG